ncbi:MAG: hypothetical protein NTY53_15225 [Kiritimatiellaeota bacterium]|nr:hypothetical protein [Kiritimatiellota bacterium]
MSRHVQREFVENSLATTGNFDRGGLMQWRQPEPRTSPTNAPGPVGAIGAKG